MGDLTTSVNPTTIIMDKNKTIVALFNPTSTPPKQYTVNINVSGLGITNPITGTYKVNEGTVLSITAIPDSGNQFTGWTGANTTTLNPLSLTITADTDLTANFAPIIMPPDQYALSISVIGQGATDPNPGSWLVDSGSNVVLTATAISGWKFKGWSGDLISANNPVTILMDKNKSIIATFEQNPITGNDNGKILVLGGIGILLLTMIRKK